MAFHTIWMNKIVIIQILLDFITEVTKEEIDCRTIEGQRRFIELFGFKRFNFCKNKYGTGNTLFKINSQFEINETIVKRLFRSLDERSKRLVGGFLSVSLNVRKKVDLAKYINLDPATIRKGAAELLTNYKLPKRSIRRSGGGRKRLDDKYPELHDVLEKVANDHLAGDPMTPRRWVRKNLGYFKGQLSRNNIKISRMSVRKYFKEHNITLRGLSKSLSTKNHKDRDLQFQQINRIKNGFLKSGKPVISIDTKKKEDIGLLYKPGKIWRKIVKKVFDHDFKSLAKTKITPFAIYDLKCNTGHFYCSKGPETSEFIVDMIVKWWNTIGQKMYKDHTHILILCDAGGGNGYRRRGWKVELQEKLASQLGLKITVCHYPVGQSKYNPIERRLFSFVSKNMLGETLDSIEKYLSILRGTTTNTGLKVEAELIKHIYKTKIEYSGRDMDRLNIKYWFTLPDWNYTFYP